MYRKFFKRIFDMVSSSIALIVLFPVLLYIAYLVKTRLGSPVLFTQVRPGKDCKLFKMYKFRTMTDAKDYKGKLLPDEVRLTSFGKKLRATSLDELPELINILKGDMSVVGSRPQLVKDMVFFTNEEMKRQTVYPGLTGLAQINGRNNITWKEKFAYDLEYVKNITFFEDMKIIYRTFFKVVKHNETSTSGIDIVEDYGDWLLSEKLISFKIYERKMHEAKKLVEEFKNE